MEPEGSLAQSHMPATCPYPEPARSSPYTHILHTWRSIFILSSHLCLDLPSCLFPSGFPTKILYKPLLSAIRSTCPTNLVILDFIAWKIFGDQYRSLSWSLCRWRWLYIAETCSRFSPVDKVFKPDFNYFYLQEFSNPTATYCLKIKNKHVRIQDTV
jgi:hypothetical protein